MKKTPFVLKNSNVTSQSVPNKKPTTSTLNYLQILKQYTSCKLVKTEASSLQPTSRTKLIKDVISPPSMNPTTMLLQQNLKSKINLNSASTKNLIKTNNQIDEKSCSSPQINHSKLMNKYMIKVPFDAYLRTSKSKENEEVKPSAFSNITDKSEKENIYFMGDKSLQKRNSKLPSNGSEKGTFIKEKIRTSPKIHLQKDSIQNSESYVCFFHPDKKAKYMKMKEENPSFSQEQTNYYCSKCAIDLALKGVRVYDIDENKTLFEVPTPNSKKESLHSFEASPRSNNPIIEEKIHLEENKTETSRRKEIEEFLLKLQATKKTGNNSFNLLEKRKVEILSFYQQQITKTEEFFKRMEIIMQTNKRILLDKLQKFKDDTDVLFKNLVKQTESNLSEIQNIEYDITENVENILKNMEEMPFKTIIIKYDSKISNYQKSFMDLYKEPLILNKILISFKNYKEQESNYSKFNEEVWNVIRPYLSFNRIPVTFLEEYNDLEIMMSPRKDEKREIFVSFENKEFFEENQKSKDDDEKTNYFYKNDKKPPIPSTTHIITENLNSPTSKKYLDLLNKINNNQENNNIFFSNFIQKNEGISSPEPNSQKLENTSLEFNKFKEKQNNQNSDNMQKNLFFSPHFRDNLEI